MSRLIDADALVTVQSFDIEHEEYEYTEMSVADALNYATNEGCPSIIYAIPISWLKEKALSMNEPFSPYMKVMFAWFKENDYKNPA